ncbi:hypothetical protein HCG51_27400 [Tolypothrix sp. PCC 7910]|uniref:hypothetical protein n=1 Tax=Tolypothrix sp. PCC 7910 TaxID=2099387 RepID=UPI0014277DAD|nr:hypothetical protein [Tolypothrix sp. PCC 7910]QIR40070.1 hypothetical protein HCG51_27400 [Tolypothrix sp. PCC 7910]
MSTTTKIGQILQAIVEVTQQVIRYIYTGATSTFTPSNDNYPATGVQPYEGDPPEQKHF